MQLTVFPNLPLDVLCDSSVVGSVLFDFHLFVNFPVFLLLIFNFTPLRQKNTLHMILISSDGSRLALGPGVRRILESVPCAPGKEVCSAAGSVTCCAGLSPCSPCRVVLPTVTSGTSSFPTITTESLLHLGEPVSLEEDGYSCPAQA